MSQNKQPLFLHNPEGEFLHILPPGSECVFQLNSQMVPLKGVVTWIHWGQDDYRYDIAIKCDPGNPHNEGPYAEEKLRYVHHKYVMRPGYALVGTDDKIKVLADIAGLTSEAAHQLEVKNVEGVAAQLKAIWQLSIDNC